MLGDGELAPEPLFAGPDAAPPALEDKAQFFAALGAQPLPTLLPYDTWGALQIPLSAAPPFTPQQTSLWVAPANVPLADPALAVVLDFLTTFLVTDQNALAVWQILAPNKPNNVPQPVVQRIFAHDPSKEVLSNAYLPGLFFFRSGGGKHEWVADDWLRDTSTLTLLWVFADAMQDTQRQREPFGHAIAKLIDAAVERGRTPSWLQPGDPDPQSPLAGSLFYKYAGFDAFWFDDWKPASLVIKTPDGVIAGQYPAIAMKFTMQEDLKPGLGRPVFFPLLSGALSVTNPQGQVLDSGPMPGTDPPVARGLPYIRSPQP